MSTSYPIRGVSMEIGFRDIGRFKILDLDGDINITDALEIETTISNLADQKNSNILINLCNAKFICSHLLSALVRMWKKMVDLNGSIGILSSDTEINYLLSVACINKIMPVYYSEELFRKELSTRASESAYLDVRVKGKYRIVNLKRPISILAGFKEFENQLTNLVKSGSVFIGCNLSRMEHLYSEIVGLMNKFSWEAKNAGGDLCLIGLKPDLKQRLSIMGFDKIIRIVESEAELE